MLRTNLLIHCGSVGAGLGLVLAVSSWGEPVPDGLPKAHEKSRYEALRAKSPFALATATVATPAPQPSFAANWFVAGIGRFGESDFVTIKSRDLSTAFSLFAQESDPKTGVALASVNWSDTVGKSTVILRKGNEIARLEFNEAEVRAAAAAPANAPRPGATAAVAIGPAGKPVGAPAGPQRRVAPIQPPK